MRTPCEEVEVLDLGMRATYRVQVHAGFTLDDAAGLAGYLARLGVSHLYSSPYLQAAAGSTHGYDVVNPAQVNAELGGPEAHARLMQALQSCGLGQVLDIVPNHMAISPDNPWWWDVLTHGPSSRYAGHFDVDWEPVEARRSNAVLVPVLGDHYGRVLEAGEIQLEFDSENFRLSYFDNRYPVDPGTLGGVLASAAGLAGSDVLAFIAGGFDRLPKAPPQDRPAAAQRARDQAVLMALLRNQVRERPEFLDAIQQAAGQLNADPDALDSFLSEQNYRLAFWRISHRELGYRRFFDINTLIGLRMEDEQVFRDTHALILEWVQRGFLHGLRIDHPDGLCDPAGYFRRLRSAVSAAVSAANAAGANVGPAPTPGVADSSRRSSPAPAAAAPSRETWIGIEKILEPGERLPEDWPVQGTTGYDFMFRANALQVDPAGEAPLTEFYTRFTGQATPYHELVRLNKLKVMDEILGSDVNRLVGLLLAICERNRRYRDYTGAELRAALCELAASLPVYRTYISTESGEVSAQDSQVIAEAVEGAKAHRPDLDPRLLDFLADLLLLRVRGQIEDELVMRFQQFTGPAMAKGVEDTTFYQYYRLVSLNEVGGDPGQFGLSIEDFHRACQETQQRWPHTLLATSTHDTKRSEDVRARLNVLAEMPEQWEKTVTFWADHNRRARRREGPDRNDEYLIYQALVGAWPIDIDRMAQYLEKALREAKRHSSWINPNQAYEQSTINFTRRILRDKEFTGQLAAFVEQIRAAGWINSLAQTVLKLTSPGIPDLYQGSELWDYSLVDPDNRRPVDYALRERLLSELESGLTPEAIWERAAEGLPKLWLIRQALALRGRRPEVFGSAGSYEPLAIDSPYAVGFTRGRDAAVIAPRLPLNGRAAWGEVWVELPEGAWRNELAGEYISGGRHTLGEMLGRFPVGLFSREKG